MVPKDWLTRLQKKDRRTIAKLITLLEEEGEAKETILEQIYPLLGKSYRIGITGPPGAGKSTLISAWITYLRQMGLTVAVVAVDPSSPFTGGAILGDRIRMNRHATDEGVLVRSLSNRGELGGLSLHALDVTNLLDAAGFDVIFLETVGVGQAEMEIVYYSDTVTLVLHPGAGDAVQISKAGIMEIADIVVVNKADRPLAERLVAELRDLLSPFAKRTWHPSIIRTVAVQNRGIELLWNAVEKHRKFLLETGCWEQKKRERLTREIFLQLQSRMDRRIKKELQSKTYQDRVEQILKQSESPQKLIHSLFFKLVQKGEVP